MLIHRLLLFMQAVAPPSDVRTIPAAERIAAVNRFADRSENSKASDAYAAAKKAFVNVFELPEARAAAPDKSFEFSDSLRRMIIALDCSDNEARQLNEWLRANREALKHLEIATNEATAFFRLAAKGDRLSDAELVPITLKIAELVLARAAQAARAEKWDEAYRWNSRTARIGEHLGQQPFLIQQFIGASFERLAAQQFVHLLRRRLPENSSTLLREFREREKRACPAEVLAAAENLYSYDWYERLINWASAPAGDAEFEDLLLIMVGGVEVAIDADASKKAARLDETRRKLRTTTIDQTWAAHRKLIELNSRWKARPFHELWRDRDKFQAEYAAIAAADPCLALVAASGEQFEVGPTNEHYIRAVTRTIRNGTAATIAILLYQRDNKKLPEKLDQATRRQTGLDATDLFSGQPLQYKRADDGTDFTLYSIGPDQKDNDGEHNGFAMEDGDFVLWPPQPPATK